MTPALKTRLIGAAVLVAIVVIVVPLFFSAEPPRIGGEQSISLDIPPSSDQQLKTQTMSVAQPAAAASATVHPVQSDHLATVNIPSRRPQDVHPESQPAAPPASQAAPASQPPAPVDRAQAQPTTPPPAPAPAKAAPTSPEPGGPGAAAHGRYTLNLGAYSNRANAEKLVAGVRKLGYPVAVEGVQANGKPAARVNAGPFASRSAAEAARLKIHAAYPHAPAVLEAGATTQQGDATAAKAPPAGRAGGWAVQLGAYSSHAEALKLRDRLRAGGFDGYVDDVTSGGRTLWRVRVGPQTQRDDAVRVATQVKAAMKMPVAVVTVP